MSKFEDPEVQKVRRGLSTMAFNALWNTGIKLTKSDVAAAVNDGRLMAARNLGKKSYYEICRYFEIDNPVKWKTFNKHDGGSDEVLARAHKAAEKNQLSVQSCIEYLRSMGYQVRKKK